MASHSHADGPGTASITGLGLIAVGAAFTAVGGLGVGFRAAGIGYLGQSLIALSSGIAMLWVGLKVAAAARRRVFESARRTPHRVAPAYLAPAHLAAEPEVRVRVEVWTTAAIEPPVLGLPPASAA